MPFLLVNLTLKLSERQNDEFQIYYFCDIKKQALLTESNFGGINFY